jgi:SAM-dependent methyltransferase
MRTAWISTRTGQFAYFDAQLGRPDWTGKRVLDFGGNAGNLLLDPRCSIAPANYWCLDIVAAAVAEGRRRHPDAHFVHYDRYNHEYNPTGTPGLALPDLGGPFDLILAWSVFTHTSRPDMLDTVAELRDLLVDGGRLAFTFFDPLWTPPPGWARRTESPGLSNLSWRLLWRGKESPHFDVDGTERRARQGLTPWAALVDDDLVLDPDHDDRGAPVRTSGPPAVHISFCSTDHMRQLFPDAEVLPPAPPERFACTVLRPPARPVPPC